uniref:Uncharacterized protein n=1 Tax=Rhizophora mucronata TaxID=61149 RepID=A0A2P2QU35_RHIMU
MQGLFCLGKYLRHGLLQNMKHESNHQV